MLGRVAHQLGLQIGVGQPHPPSQLEKGNLPPPDHAPDGFLRHIDYLSRRSGAEVAVLAAAAVGAEGP